MIGVIRGSAAEVLGRAVVDRARALANMFRFGGSSTVGVQLELKELVGFQHSIIQR